MKHFPIGPKQALLLVLACIVVTQQVDAAIIMNGSFETDTNNDHLPDNWTFDGNVVRTTTAGTMAGGYAMDGDHFLIFSTGNSTPNGIIEQTLQTDAGDSYEVQFSILQRGPNLGITTTQARASALDVDDNSILGAITGLDPRSNGPPPAPNDPALFPYLTFTFQFTATDSQTLLRLEDVSTNNGINADLLLDNIQVQVLNKPVPEPSSLFTFAGLSLCLGAVGHWRKRRHRG